MCQAAVQCYTYQLLYKMFYLLLGYICYCLRGDIVELGAYEDYRRVWMDFRGGGQGA